jgi:hypothetical protein
MKIERVGRETKNKMVKERNRARNRERKMQKEETIPTK